ncbi:hypothetical protein SALB1_3299 [Salinisphaera sp. LB1]|nr:hypothetical protein SALB1_3299 [Salinisphaera sp. LB1]
MTLMAPIHNKARAGLDLVGRLCCFALFQAAENTTLSICVICG